ncbi:polyunsaturated fatty acid lipoxygenase ALOX15B-like [Amphiura filiformis]|uniref:polyunsaturated fatty acid lipoxygenase ALOX15B-like n=1 Tax=Amphiura filiformis TaxID=82378 RepID=UPI003B20EBA1
MGNRISRLRQWATLSDGDHQFQIEIVTGEYGGQNIVGKGNVCIRLWNVDGSTNHVSNIFTYSGRYFFKGSKNILYVSAPFERIDQIEIWIYRAGNNPNLNWFVDTITCTEAQSKKKTLFPMGRWVTMRHQLITAVDSTLPLDDRNAERRHEEIFMNRAFFHFSQPFAGGIPTMTNVLQTSETFSKSYFFNVFLMQGFVNKIKQYLLPLFTRKWRHLTDIDNIYDRCCLSFEKPPSVDTYMKVLKTENNEGQFDQTELDKIFATQRLTGTNPTVITRVESAKDIEDAMRRPDGVEGSLDDLLKPHMEENTLEEAVEKELLYKVDYTNTLADVPCKTGFIAAPIALFYVNKDKDLMPVAIQLFKKDHPHSAGRDNPIFTPDDDSYTWLLAKMWFNNADASFHESASHLGFTHLIMETIYIALQQTVSISHPLYRLMAPHFRYLMNVNSIAWDLLLNKGGWVDTEMNIGVEGMLEIIRRKFEGFQGSVEPWRLHVEGNIENDIKNRKVENLPKYTFRDDAVRVHKIIKAYVAEKVEESYNRDPANVRDDYEIQAWGKMLYDPTNPADPAHSGCGIKGLAFEHPKEIDGQMVYFQTLDHVIDTITSTIYTCSAAHAAVNFLQYDNYGFPLNYPALLLGDPPRSKAGFGPDNQKVQRTADDILQALPTKQQTLDTMNMTKILSNKATVDKDDKNNLGNFPIQYQFIPDGGVPDNVKTFKESLYELSLEIDKRNKELEHDKKHDEVYDVLDPAHIPNSISI